jgi:hypothetical protein
MTYEDREEGAFLEAFNVTRSGELENSVFAILSSDGKQQLVHASRSTHHAFNNAQTMAETMNRIARPADSDQKNARSRAELPKVPNVRLAVDVAACDNQPLVVLFAASAKNLSELEQRLAGLAWSEQFIGKFVYVTASDAKELTKIEGRSVEAGMLVVQADQFGMSGKTLSQVDASASLEDLVKCLQTGVEKHAAKDKTFVNHVGEGHRQGIFWETAIPVTDPMEKQARERGRQRGPQQD